ncbi:MAG TPA: DUF4082 domain-containing protein [Clostridiales bacterium]|nr:DUF4082 domain-containing protein [Clostridiales bacterium]
MPKPSKQLVKFLSVLLIMVMLLGLVTVPAAELPDLIVTNVTWTPSNPAAGDRITFTITMKNQGTGASPDGIQHSVTLFNDWTPITWNSIFSSLAPGESVDLQIEWTPATAGNYLMRIWTDDVNRIEESNEDNNYYVFNLNVKEFAEPMPDLIVTDITWSPAKPSEGEEVTFAVEIKNAGNLATPDGVIHGVTLSIGDTVIASSDAHTSSIGAGNSASISLNGTWTAGVGLFTFTGTVDGENRIEESNESNNSLNKSLTIAKEVEGLAPENLLGSITGEGFFDNASYNLGTIFIPRVAGKVTGIRVFGVDGETGDHTAYLFDFNTMAIIGGPYTLNYDGENAWVEFPLAEPVDVEANKQYMVVVSTGEEPRGYYPAVSGIFDKPGGNGDSLDWPVNAGRFGNKDSTMPLSSWGNSCYMRDVIFVPAEVLPAVTAVNAAGTDPAAVEAALTSSELGLDLTIYNILLDSEKEQVIAAIIAQKPADGYAKRSEIQAALDSIAIPIYQERLGSLFRGFNEATTEKEIRTAILAPELDLDLFIYNALSLSNKKLVAQAILDERPEDGYHSIDDIQNVIDTATGSLLSLPTSGDIPVVHEEFHPWEGAVSPDGIWRKAGPWRGTGNNLFEVERAITQETYNGQDGGFLILKSLANSMNGAEIQTLTSYGYGYYETRMKPTGVSGVCNSFFWVESPTYGPHEIDVEFFTIKGNVLDFNTHPLNRVIEFSPDYIFSEDFHRYGFLWTPGRVDFVVDGQIVKTRIHESMDADVKGYIMMNSWTNYEWGGGPPAVDTEAVYDYVKHYSIEKVDKTSLENAIEAAQKLNESLYTEETWQAMLEALDAAMAVDNSIYSTQAQIDEAEDGLREAINGLKYIRPAESMFADWDDVESLKTDLWDCNYGIMFSAAVPGRITHIRVFGLEGETGDHTAYIWENESNKIVGGPYTINYTGSNEWVEFELPEPIEVPVAGKLYTVVVTTGDTGLVPIWREGTAKAGSNGSSLYWPKEAGVFGPMGTNRPTVSWRYNYLRDIVFVPYAENPAVTEVNAAADLAETRAAIEKYPELLDLSQFNRLSDDDKNRVAQAVLDGKSGGYGRVGDIQAIIDSKSNEYVNAEIKAAIENVNDAENAVQLSAAITSPFLGLNLDLYNTLEENQKTTVLNNLLNAKPDGGFADADEFKDAFDTAVKDFMYSLITPWDPDFFPIGVWLQNPAPSVMEQYKAIGINTYIGLSSGGFNETVYNTLKQYGMKAIVNMNNYARQNMDKVEEVVLAWLQEDEPDIARFTPDWWPLPPISPEETFRRYVEFKRYNKTKPVYMNLSQGVAKPDWPGRGVDTNYTYMYPEYAKGADILSFDVYPVNSGYDLSLVAKGVDNLYGYSDGRQPVWAFIETTKYDTGNQGRPTPEQVKTQVWMALVHGARGIEYFCHQFSPFFVEAGPLHEDYSDIREMIASINAQITELAPVLNSPTISGYATVDTVNDVPVDIMTKKYNGIRYIFSVGMADEAATATFHVASGDIVKVIGEDRVIKVENGQFSDEFAPYEVHLYEVRATDEFTYMVDSAYESGKIDNGGIYNSLMAKINKINEYAAQGDFGMNFINALKPLEKQVKAQYGKHIDVEFADLLLDLIQEFRDLLKN